MQEKVCSRCSVSKILKDFNKSKSSKFGVHNHCRDCQKIVRREWYLKNKESEIEKSSEYSKTDRCKELARVRYENNKDEILLKNRKRRATPHARALANTARNKMYHENPSFRVSVNLRSRIRLAIKQSVKSASTEELTGCSFDELKEYIESLFQDGMSWDNYRYRGWHIDHIIPCDSFDLTNPEEQKKCFHYTNLQPMWWKENLSKGNK